MAQRSIALAGLTSSDDVPNSHIPPSGTAARRRLAEEYERGRRAALDELRQMGAVHPAPSSAGTYNMSGYPMMTCWTRSYS